MTHFYIFPDKHKQPKQDVWRYTVAKVITAHSHGNGFLSLWIDLFHGEVVASGQRSDGARWVCCGERGGKVKTGSDREIRGSPREYCSGEGTGRQVRPISFRKKFWCTTTRLQRYLHSDFVANLRPHHLSCLGFLYSKHPSFCLKSIGHQTSTDQSHLNGLWLYMHVSSPCGEQDYALSHISSPGAQDGKSWPGYRYLGIHWLLTLFCSAGKLLVTSLPWDTFRGDIFVSLGHSSSFTEMRCWCTTATRWPCSDEDFWENPVFQLAFRSFHLNPRGSPGFITSAGDFWLYLKEVISGGREQQPRRMKWHISTCASLEQVNKTPADLYSKR